MGWPTRFFAAQRDLAQRGLPSLASLLKLQGAGAMLQGSDASIEAFALLLLAGTAGQHGLPRLESLGQLQVGEQAQLQELAGSISPAELQALVDYANKFIDTNTQAHPENFAEVRVHRRWIEGM
eukprot:scaffold91207_cov17-Tisochrysis_lutea.AAC.1